MLSFDLILKEEKMICDSKEKKNSIYNGIEIILKTIYQKVVFHIINNSTTDSPPVVAIIGTHNLIVK